MSAKSNFSCISLNCRGLNLKQNCEVRSLLNKFDVVCFQETWLSKHECNNINSSIEGFHGIADSPNDDTNGILIGRQNRREGVAIMWKSCLDSFITPIKFEFSWIVGVKVTIDKKIMYILNVYLPYDSPENEEEFVCRLSNLHVIVEDLDCTCINIVGDFNSNILNKPSKNAINLQEYCDFMNYRWSSKHFLPNDSFTYVSEAWGTPSWLDHCISSTDGFNAIANMNILKDFILSDHFPLMVNFKINYIPEIGKQATVSPKKLVNWAKVKTDEKEKYRQETDELLRSIPIPYDTLLCKESDCSNSKHVKDLNDFYCNIVHVIQSASDALVKNINHGSSKHNRPGWSEHCSELYSVAKSAHKEWLSNGKPKQGPLFEHRKRSRAQFKFALRFIKSNEDQLRADSLAKRLLCKNSNDFWKEIKQINNDKLLLPNTIEDAKGSQEISKLWADHYKTLFNCVNDCRNVNELCENFVYSGDMDVTPDNVKKAINNLDSGKSCGADNIFAENLKFCSDFVNRLLSECFSGFISHGFLPDSLINVILVPVVKNKGCSIREKSNYRPIALANILSKVFEYIIYERLECYLHTCQNQFGFKKHHGTDMCIYSLKECVLKYNSLNSNVYSCYLDVSKAFDRVNHYMLFKKLITRGVPVYIVRMLIFWYVNQTVFVKWNNVLSDGFTVTNGVRQGGILSPYLFCVFMDDLSLALNDVPTGCFLGEQRVNHLMYADDIVLLSPSASGLRQLLSQCELYGQSHDILFNSSKCNVMVFSCTLLKSLKDAEFKINEKTILQCSQYKYLGHIVVNTLNDNLDIQRQIKKLYAQGNILIRKFSNCSESVKIMLFRTYCTSLYTPHLWWNFSQTCLQKLIVAYNNIFRVLTRQPKFCSASHMFVVRNLPTCTMLIRKHIYSFICRISIAVNVIINNIVHNSDIMFRSRIWSRWLATIFKNQNEPA